MITIVQVTTFLLTSAIPNALRNEVIQTGSRQARNKMVTIRACVRYTNGSSLAPGRLLLFHSRQDGGDAAGWIRSDARVHLSLAVDDDADDAAV